MTNASSSEASHCYTALGGYSTLFAALNVRDGTVLGRCMAQHRHQEFVRILNAIERAVPAGKLIQAIANNYATHKHPKVRAWLERHPRWVFHCTPTSASWINAVESFFLTLTRQRLKRGVFLGPLRLVGALLERALAGRCATGLFVLTLSVEETRDRG